MKKHSLAIRFSRRSRYIICLLPCVLVIPAVAGELEPITVQGTQENERLEHLDESFFESFTRNRIFSEDLKKEMAPDIKTALRDVPNIAVIDSGAFSKRVEIRGLSSDRITYLVDDVAIGNQSLTHAGGGEINVSVYFAKAVRRSHPHNSAVFDIDGVREKQVAHWLVSCDPILLRRSTARLLSISALRQAGR